MSVFRDVTEGALRAYAQILFSRSWWVGGILLIATWTSPSLGAPALAGVLLTQALALAMGYDRDAVRAGTLSYNALLVFLGLAAVVRGAEWWALAPLGAALSLLAHVGLEGGIRYHLRLPVLSIPFVGVSWALLSLLVAAREQVVVLDLPMLAAAPIPWGNSLLQSFGAILFMPHWIPGALVALALGLHSRIGATHALFGWVGAWALARALGIPEVTFVGAVGFNALLVGVALGGVYLVPSAASAAVALGGGALSAGLSLALLEALRPWGLPPLTAPFNAVALLTLYALAMRATPRGVVAVDRVESSPEETLHRYLTRVRRFHRAAPVRLSLPFRGTWICTQGNDGAHTHQGLWRHGLDFEVADREGNRFTGDGQRREDWLCYRLPVVAMGEGTVVRIVDGVPDNAPGEMNTTANWGNLVVIRYAPQLYGLVAHLSPGTIQVTEGQTVLPGALLGLCGASGRSPVPHLHVQLQRSPVVGDPTHPIAFSDAVEEGESPRLRQEIIPIEGVRYRNTDSSTPLAAALRWPQGTRLIAEVEDGQGRTWKEVLQVEVNLLGNRYLASDRGGVLWFEVASGVFVIYDHEGPREGALYALYLALARVPLDSARALTWEDSLNPRRVVGSLGGWFADWVAAFATAPTLPVYYRLDTKGEVRTLTGSAPLSREKGVVTEAIFQGEQLTVLSVSVAGRQTRVHLEVLR